MRKADIFPAWRRILGGYRPLLSIEITKECPLHCPGCYAYGPEHLGGTTLRQLSDYRGDVLVRAVVSLVRRYRPIHVSIVGGEPLVRYRELDALLPQLDAMGVEVQLVTSAVRPIPAHWASLKGLHVVVSIDGLPAEHNRRRAPATYDRVLRHIAGHTITVHCTITRQLLGRAGYLHDFAQFWSERSEVGKIWFSLFTPQKGEQCEERLRPEDRTCALEELAALAGAFPKVYLPDYVLEGYAHPPASPASCLFAQLTTCLSADLQTKIEPCQFGGNPVCTECGCIASAGLASIGRYRLAGVIPISKVFSASRRFGGRLSTLRTAPSGACAAPNPGDCAGSGAVAELGRPGASAGVGADERKAA